MPNDSPRLLSDFKPLPGVLKADYEDFEVEEIPLYPADNVGTHLYFLLEKRGLSTMQAVADVARALGVAKRDIGYAGLKDARAVTRQWMSVEHVSKERLMALEIPRIKILDAKLHGNKLRLGHLRANRFTIRVREFNESRFQELKNAFERLMGVGCPNYFGEQRFGSRGDSWKVGRALLAGDADEAIDAMLGRPQPDDAPALRQARTLYEQGQFQAASRAWPAMFSTERRVLRAMLSNRGKKRRAIFAIEPHIRRLYTSAFQSHLFNQVVAARLPHGLSTLLLGDLAFLHVNGAVFRVLDPAVEQPRADRGEISPTGPLFGYRMTRPAEEPLKIELSVFTAAGLDADSFQARGLNVKGSRRALRFLPAEPQIELGADRRGPYLEFRFVLPKGCYATSLLREFIDTAPLEEESGAELESD